MGGLVAGGERGRVSEWLVGWLGEWMSERVMCVSEREWVSEWAVCKITNVVLCKICTLRV